MSAEQNPEVVDAYLTKEVAASRAVAVGAEHQLTGVHISRFGVIPKPHQPGKWRLMICHTQRVEALTMGFHLSYAP